MGIEINFDQTAESNIPADKNIGQEQFHPGDGFYSYSPRDFATPNKRQGTFFQECAKMAAYGIHYCYYAWKNGYEMEQALRFVHHNCSLSMPVMIILYYDEITKFQKLQESICALVYQFANSGHFSSELEIFEVIWNVHCDLVAAHYQNINTASDNEPVDLTELEWQEPVADFDAQQPIEAPEGEELREAYDLDDWKEYTKFLDEEERLTQEFVRKTNRESWRRLLEFAVSLLVFAIFSTALTGELMPAVSKMAHSAADFCATTNEYLQAKVDGLGLHKPVVIDEDLHGISNDADDGPFLQRLATFSATFSADYKKYTQELESMVYRAATETDECVPPTGVFHDFYTFEDRRRQWYDCHIEKQCTFDDDIVLGLCGIQLRREMGEIEIGYKMNEGNTAVWVEILPMKDPTSAPPNQTAAPEAARSIVDPVKTLAGAFQTKVQEAGARATQFYQELKSTASDFVSRIVDLFKTLARTLQHKAREAVAGAMQVCHELESIAVTKTREAVARAMQVCHELGSIAVTQTREVVANATKVYQKLKSAATATLDFSSIARKSSQKVQELLNSQTEPISNSTALPAFNAFDTIALIERFMTPSQFDEDRGVAYFDMVEKLRPAEQDEEQHCCRRDDLLCRFYAIVSDYVPKLAPYLQLPENGDDNVEAFDALDFVIQHDKTLFQPIEFPEPDVPPTVQLRLLFHQYVADFRDAVASSLHRLAHWVSTNEPTPSPPPPPSPVPPHINQDGNEIPASKYTRVCVSGDSLWDVASETLQLAEAYAHEAFQAHIANSPNHKMIFVAAAGSEKENKPCRHANADTNTEELQDQSDSALRPSYKFSRSWLSSSSPNQINVAHQLKPDQNCEQNTACSDASMAGGINCTGERMDGESTFGREEQEDPANKQVGKRRRIIQNEPKII